MRREQRKKSAEQSRMIPVEFSRGKVCLYLFRVGVSWRRWGRGRKSTTPLCHIREVMRNLSPLYLHETPLHLKQGICVVVNDTIYSSLAN
jgi:hypothetical protein